MWKETAAKTFRYADRAQPTERLVYKSGLSNYLSGFKWLVLGSTPLVIYFASKSIRTAFLTADDPNWVHPSQVDHNAETPLFAAVVSVILTSCLCVALTIVSRVVVRRVYYHADTDTFRVVISKLIGNRLLMARPGELSVNKDRKLFSHTLKGQKVYIEPLQFDSAYSYHTFLGYQPSAGMDR